MEVHRTTPRLIVFNAINTGLFTVQTLCVFKYDVGEGRKKMSSTDNVRNEKKYYVVSSRRGMECTECNK